MAIAECYPITVSWWRRWRAGQGFRSALDALAGEIIARLSDLVR
jgi:hypothetical protein